LCAPWWGAPNKNNKDNKMKALALVVAWIAVAGLVLITRQTYRVRRLTR
jgi:hypothetical protein